MALFVNKLKLKAAAGSMHQFCPVVRAIFPEVVDDDVTEAVTVYLYTHLAEEVFGPRFTGHLRERLRQRYRFGRLVDIEPRLDRIERNLAGFEAEAAAVAPTRTVYDQFTDHVRSVIRALLAEAGFAGDPALVRNTFPKFEDAVRALKSHLTGIKRQARFVMRG